MAVKDKLVNLEDLAVVNTDLQGKVSDLKSAFKKSAEALYKSIYGTNDMPMELTNAFINSSAKWANDVNGCIMLPIASGDSISITAGSTAGYYAFLASNTVVHNATPEFADGETGRRSVSANQTVTTTAPSGTKYLYVLYAMNNGTNIYYPKSIIINGIEQNANAFKNSFRFIATVDSSVTTLASLVEIGTYFIPREIVTNLTDLPKGFPINANPTLINYPIGDRILQVLYQSYFGLNWLRTINSEGSSVGSWAFSPNNGINLSQVDGVDCDNIKLSTFYFYGSGMNAAHIPPGSAAGVVYNIYRDENTAYQLGISYSNGSAYIRQKKSGTWTDWDRFAKASEIPVVPPSIKKPLFIYEAGSFDSGKATERILIYIPCGDHYVAYYFYHYVVASINCDCWRIMSAYAIDPTTFDFTKKLTANGEWECALRLSERDDFSGGSTHGDEVMSGWNIFVDGKRVTDNLVSYSTRTEFEELRFVRQSIMYDPADSITAIADHGCEYVFNEDGLVISQSIKWLAAENLANCFMAMFTPSKNYTDHLYTDLDYSLIDVTNRENYSISKPGAKKTVIYGQETDVLCEFSIERYPTGLVGGDRWSVTDNGGLAYNKLYYYAASSGATVAVGDLWQSKTVYKIKA